MTSHEGNNYWDSIPLRLFIVNQYTYDINWVNVGFYRPSNEYIVKKVKSAILKIGAVQAYYQQMSPLYKQTAR